MLVPFPRYPLRGQRLPHTRRAIAVVEACEATFGAAVTRRTRHKHLLELEGRDPLAHQGKLLATSRHAPYTAKSSAYRFEHSSDRF